jgi:hypothetical protein
MAKLLSGTRIYGTATIDTQLFVGNFEDSISTNTGALQIQGGLGLSGNIFAGGIITATTFSGNLDGELIGGTAGQLVYQSATDVTDFVGPGTLGQILVSAGASAPVYTNTSSIYVNSSVNAQTLFGGTNGQLVYQSSAGTTAFTGPGTAGQVLISGGTNGPLYQNTLTVLQSRVFVTSNLGANSTQTGALQVVNGGIGVGGGGYFGGVVTATLFVGTVSGSINIADNIGGGVLGDIPYQIGLNQTRFIPAGVSGSLLQMGATTASFISSSSILVGLAAAIAGGTAGQLLYQNGASSTAFAGPGVSGQILLSGGNTGPTYVNTSNVYVAASIRTQTLFGGSAGQLVYQSAGNTTAFAGPGTAGQLVVSNGTNGPTFVGPGSAGQILVSAGASVPVYTNTSTIQVGFAASILAGTTGQLLYQSAANTTQFLGPGTTGQILVSAGASAPVYTNTSSIYVNSAVNAQTLFGGTNGQLVYQSSANTTAFAGPGTAGQVLTSNGTNGPVYVNTGSLYVGRALIADALAGDASRANDINGGLAGQILIQDGTSSTTFISTGSAGSFLQMGINTATFVTTSSMYVDSAVNAQRLFGGTAGQLVYQSGVGTTAFAGPGNVGQLIVSNGTSGPTFVGPGTAGQLLVSNGASVPVYTNTGSIYVGFSNQTNNVRAGTAGQLVYQAGASSTAFVGPGTSGQVLISQGTAAPTYVNTSSFYVGYADFVRNIQGGALGQIVFQSGPNATTFLNTSTPGAILVQGANNPEYASTASVYVGNSVFAQELRGGAAGAIVYQSAVDNTEFLSGSAGQLLQSNGTSAPSFFGPGTAGQVLTSNGASGPVYVNTGTLYVGRAVLADSATLATRANNISGGRAGLIPIQNGTNSTTFINSGTVGTLLQAGVNTATFVSTSTIQVGFAANLLAGAAGSLAYQTAANATGFLSIGSVNSILVSNGSVPSWSLNPTIGGNVTITGNLTVQGTTVIVDSTVTNVSDPIITIGTGPGGTAPTGDDGKDRGIAFDWHNGTAARVGFFGFDRSTGFFTFVSSASIINEVVSPAGGTTKGAIDAFLAGGTAGQLVYQSAANTTAFAGPGTAGQVLTSGGTGAPTYVTTTTLYVGRALIADVATGGAATANDLNGGTAGQLVYQIGPGDTGFAGPGTVGQLVVSNGTSGPTFAGPGTAGQLLVSAGAASPVYTNTGSIFVGRSAGLLGGTSGQLVYQSAANTTAFVGPGTAGQILVSGGTSAPSYTNTGSIYVGFATGSNNLRGGSLGQLPYQSAANTTAFVGPGNSGQLLQSNGPAAPSYVNTSSIFVGGAVNVLGGTAGQLVYQSAANTTAFAGPGTAGQLLVSNGTSGPVYTNTSSIQVGFAANILGGSAGQFVLQSGPNSTTFISTASIYAGSAVLANSLRGGAGGSIPYQSGANATTFVSIGSNGQVLGSNGSTPVWVNIGSITAGTATVANTLLTIQRPNAGLHYLTFVDSNNATATAEAFYTTSTFNLDPRTGNVAIGTTATTNKFEVAGTQGQLFSVTDTFTGTIFAASDVSGIPSIEVLDTGLVKLAQYNGVVTVGTGTEISGAMLTVWGNTRVSGVVTATTFVGNLSGNLLGGTAGQLVYQSAANTTAFAGPGSAGNVLTSGGTGAPTYVTTGSLYVGRAITADGTTGNAATVSVVRRPNTGFHFITFVDSNNATATAEAQYTTSSLFLSPQTGVLTATSISIVNSLGVGTALPSGTAGEIRASNEITAYFSDRRLKENVQIIDDALVKVLSLTGITYTPNDLAESFGYDKTKKLVGVFADEIDAVLPEAVRPAPFDIDENGNSKSGENYKTVQYEKIVPLLIEAIKDQQKVIEKLQADLDSFKKYFNFKL